MKRHTLELDNIKCHGCAASIKSRLKKSGFENIIVDVDQGKVEIDAPSDRNIEEALSLLKKMGYPERHQSKLGDAARSYVSCMIGRLKDKTE